MGTSFWSQRSLNITGSPAAVKMLISPRMSPRLGVNSEAETLFKWRNFLVKDGFDEGTEMMKVDKEIGMGTELIERYDEVWEMVLFVQILPSSLLAALAGVWSKHGPALFPSPVSQYGLSKRK